MKKLPVFAGILIFLMLTAVPATMVMGASAGPAVPSPEKMKKVLAGFERYAEKAMKEWKVPGMAIAIVRDDKVIYAKGFGVRKIGTKDPVTPETIFQIGSTTKAFAATLIGMLVDEKRLNWQDRMIDHISSFRMYDPWVTREFTVEDMLAHRNGLASHAGDVLLTEFDRDRIKQAIGHIKPVSSFRSRFAYSNVLYLYSADLVEKYSKMTWEENIRERIFKPLGMTRSSVDVTPFLKDKNVAWPHLRLKDDRIIPIPLDNTLATFGYVAGPAGAINSTVLDMAKWIRFNMDGGEAGGRRLVSKESMEFLHTPKAIMAPGLYYCQGWIYKESKPYSFLWHNGATGGHKTMVALIPEIKTGMVVIANAGGAEIALPEALVDRFFRQYFNLPVKDTAAEMLKELKDNERLEEAKKPKRPARPNPPLPLETYTGTYSDAVCGKATIELDQGTLYVREDARNQAILSHFDRDTFVFTSPFTGEEEGFTVFRTDETGKVRGFTVDVLEQYGCEGYIRQR